MASVASIKISARLFVVATVTLAAFLAVPEGVSAQSTERFFVEKSYDASNRSTVDSFELLTGTHARIFIDEEYWDDLSSSKQEALTTRLTTLLSLFDTTIYPRVTAAYGEPWTPGIDNDTKITILFTEIENGVGGYFRFDDEKALVEESRSNEREMLYMNVLYSDQYVIREFMAHELVHLIHYNQKNRVHGVREQVWLSELLAEMGPRVAGLHTTKYTDTNFQDRVEEFLKDPNNSLTEWDSDNADYSAVAMFGHYLYTQYGIAPLREAMRSPLKGVDALNDGLSKAGTGVTVQQAFSNWAITNAVNNCALASGRYCYNDPQLPYSRVHIVFQASGQKVEDGAAFAAPIEPWSTQWLKVEYDEGSKAQDVLIYKLAASVKGSVKVPYAVYKTNGDIVVREFTVRGGGATFALEGFGEAVEAVIFAPLNTTDNRATFQSELYTDDVIPVGSQVYEALSLVDSTGGALVDGDLIRASGSDDIYIAKFSGDKLFRRLILNPEIFDSYGHLEWSKVKTVSAEVLAEFTDSQFVMEVYADGTPVNGRVYQIFSTPGADTGTKRLASGGYDSASVYSINHLEAAETFYPTTN
jgi:hypothetical protein